ncbi:MAG: helix-turn-helix transcriptional regulator [Gemmataceae bacterium]
MDAAKRDALKQAGFRVGTVQDFLGLTDAEHQLVQLKLRVAAVSRSRREALQLSQKELAAKIGSSQSRVAKIEAGESTVSLDLMFRYLFAVGGKLRDLETVTQAPVVQAEKKARSRRKPLEGADAPAS